MKVLITGIAGALGQETALMLRDHGHDVVGMDVRKWPSAEGGITVHQVDLRKRAAEDVFRREALDAVIHMATVTAFAVRGEERFRINLGGTRAVFEHSRTYGVKHVIFVGRHTFYGAGPDAPLFHTEDEPPMAMATFPELADLVAADLFAATEIWRIPELTTTVLRVCYTLGPRGHGTLAAFLRGPYVPTLAGFDPLFHYLHEKDVALALLRTLEKCPRGVFNVAGPPPLPLSVIIRETGRKRVRVPEPLFPLLVGRLGLPRLPRGATEHIKYPVVVDASAFQRTTGFACAFDQSATLCAYRKAFPIQK